MARLVGRRAALAVVATGLGGLAGCLSAQSFPDADVIVGPDGAFVFEPAELTVAVGDRVTWGFASSGHNVCCRPGDSDAVALPRDGEPFASYGPDAAPHRAVVPQGETYAHALAVGGRYDYVCVPHVTRDMTGTIRVVER